MSKPRLIATKVSQDAHSELLKRCADLRCSPYEYLRLLVETDMDMVEKEVKKDEPVRKGIEITR